MSIEATTAEVEVRETKDQRSFSVHSNFEIPSTHSKRYFLCHRSLASTALIPTAEREAVVEERKVPRMTALAHPTILEIQNLGNADAADEAITQTNNKSQKRTRWSCRWKNKKSTLHWIAKWWESDIVEINLL